MHGYAGRLRRAVLTLTLRCARRRSPPYTMQALQMRPSLAYLDKEKEAGAAGKKQKEQAEEEQKPELMQLTVQVGGCVTGSGRCLGQPQ